MGKGFGADLASAHALNAVVTDGSGRVQRLVHVTLFEDFSLLGGVRPNAGKAISLEFQADGQVVAGTWIGAHRLANLALDAEQALDVMADLVRQYVGLGEISGRTETAFEFLVEAEIDVDLLVGGTIEGSGSRPGQAAC